jgi:hypothetical protein
MRNGPDTESPLTVLGAGLRALAEGLMVRDSKGDVYYLKFDPVGLPHMATGADIVATGFFYLMGYNVAPGAIAYISKDLLRLDPAAQVFMLGGKQKILDREYLDLALDKAEQEADGQYRVAAHHMPRGNILGGFKFHGTRGDDPNDVFPHEDRRELRGLRVFAAWLNHTTCSSITSMDFYLSGEEGGYVKHYLSDFMAALGSGYDFGYRIVPKNPSAGHEHTLWGDRKAALITALSFGIWERPWMKIRYPYPEYAEVGRLEAEHFEPEGWKPDYPNAAFERMLPDDAFWAARIVAQFSDADIRTVVQTGEYSDPEAADYLAETLIKRRDKIIDYYFRRVNPLHHFRVCESGVGFDNLGEDYSLASGSSYAYEWYRLNNETSELSRLVERQHTLVPLIPLPGELPEYLMVRIRTLSSQVPEWRKNVDVYWRRQGDEYRLVGIERDVGMAEVDVRPTIQE